jgi:hypothetical protein
MQREKIGRFVYNPDFVKDYAKVEMQQRSRPVYIPQEPPRLTQEQIQMMEHQL